MQINIPLLGKINIDFRKNSTENDPSWERFKALLYGYSGADMPITAETAIKTATVIRCVDVVAKNMAALPLDLYRRTAAGADKAKDHRLYGVLHSIANRETTAFDFWMMFFYNLMLTPAAYAYVERDGNGFVTGLYNLPSRYCRLKRNEQTKERYVEYFNGKIRTFIYPENLFYMPGPRLSDPDNPLDPMNLASKVLGLSSSLNDFAANYFKNGAHSGGVVTLATAASQTVFDQFKKDFCEMYTGVQNSSKVMFLNGSAKFEKLSHNPNDSQALESRQFQVLEVCRMMGVTPYKVFEYGRATWGNVEQINIEFVQETLSPHAVHTEQTILKDLLSPFERQSMYAKFNFYGLLRGDTAAQTAWFNAARQGGIYNANEIRAKLDENRIPKEEGGDAYLVNGNMVSIATAAAAQPQKANVTIN